MNKKILISLLFIFLMNSSYSIALENISPNQAVSDLETPIIEENSIINVIEITGNNLVDEGLILETISLKKGGVFDRNKVQEDLKVIYGMGYFTEKLKAIPKVTPNGIKLRIVVEENVPITGFNITGNTVVSTEELATIYEPQSGLPQNITLLNESIAKIEQLYADKGYILTRIKKVTDDPDGIINIEINEGIIDEIKIEGNTRTKEFVIKRNMLVEPGTVYNENLLKQDLGRIFATRSFGDVKRVLLPSVNDPNKYQLTIKVDEKRTGSISLGGGLDTGTGVFGTVGYMDSNFRGLGQEISANLSTGSGVLLDDADVVQKSSFQLELNFVEPRFKETLNSLQVKGFARDYASYQVPLALERRFGTEVEVARPIKKIPHLAGSVSLGIEDVSVREGDYATIVEKFAANNIDIANRANQLQGGTFLSLGPALVYDTRNNILNPTSGWYASTSFKESFQISGDANTFGRVNLTARKFYPVGEQSTFIVGGKIASKVLGDLPEFAAFRLGGSTTIRGFREGDVGNGSGFMMATAEYRTPIPFMNKITEIPFFRQIKLAAFLDAGTLFNETITNDLFNRPGYGIAAGGGLRLNIPGMGPLNLDYGVPLTEVGSGNKKGRFTFGIGEVY